MLKEVRGLRCAHTRSYILQHDHHLASTFVLLPINLTEPNMQLKHLCRAAKEMNFVHGHAPALRENLVLDGLWLAKIDHMC